MDLMNVIYLAVIQGLTEFLPISSSGHLVLSEALLNIKSTDITLEIFLHFGTFLSVLVIFRQDIFDILKDFFKHFWKIKSYPKLMKEESSFSMSLFILVSMIPAGLAGIFFKDFFESLFQNVHLVGITLIITGIILFLSQFGKMKDKNVGMGSALLIGIVQAFAIVPGISRSGSTISTALLLGINKEKAARFSFIMALPVVFGATFLEVLDMSFSEFQLKPILLGIVVSFISGYLAINWLLKLVVKGRFHYFSYYCIIIGFITIAFT